MKPANMRENSQTRAAITISGFVDEPERPCMGIRVTKATVHRYVKKTKGRIWQTVTAMANK